MTVSIPVFYRLLAGLLVTIGTLASPTALLAEPPRKPVAATWASDCVLEDAKVLTMDGLGAMQGVSFHDGRIYLYGDCYDAKPRVGVIREYSADFQATGRVIWLRDKDKPLLRHPTGLTWHPRWGTFLGDTVAHKGVIYRIDWQRALQDGDLSRAVLAVIEDDAAVNGCRPEFVSLNGRDLLATADYGDIRPEVRLYDPQRLLGARRTSAPGVIAYRFLAPPFNQNLHWDKDARQLTCVLNVIEGRGWRLETLDLDRAVADGRAWGPGACIRTQTFPNRDELEGYRPQAPGIGLFVTSSRKDNLVVARIRSADRLREPAVGRQEPISPPRVSLAVLVVFDQMRADYLERWASLFTGRGFRRIQTQGAWFTNCNYPYAHTVTAAGHASILTGCSPRAHGIIANSWYERHAHREVEATQAGRTDPRTGVYQPSQAPSAEALLAPTLGDSLKSATGGHCKVIGMSLKDRAALFSVGARADACYWLDSKTGKFVGSSPLPAWVHEYNDGHPADAEAGKSWDFLVPDRSQYLSPWGATQDSIIHAEGFGQGPTFPHHFPSKVDPTYYAAVMNSPAGNELLLNFAKTAIREERLGQREERDLLAVSFSSNDLIGHCWGPDSREVMDITLWSDRTLAELLDFLDQQIGRGKYVLAVTADHGVSSIPEVAKAHGMDAGRIDPAELTDKAESFLTARFGSPPGRWIEATVFPWIYLNREVISRHRMDVDAIADALAAWFPSQPGIARAYAGHKLAGPMSPEDEIDRCVYRSYAAARAGDVYLLQKPNYLASGLLTRLNASHGTPYEYDTHVPLLFVGPGKGDGKVREPVTPAAIAAVFADFLGVPRPSMAQAPVPVALQGMHTTTR
jgi:arylsulfatase A-like enzyme